MMRISNYGMNDSLNHNSINLPFVDGWNRDELGMVYGIVFTTLPCILTLAHMSVDWFEKKKENPIFYRTTWFPVL